LRATSAEGGLQMFVREEVDLLLLLVSLPGISGFAVRVELPLKSFEKCGWNVIQQRPLCRHSAEHAEIQDGPARRPGAGGTDQGKLAANQRERVLQRSNSRMKNEESAGAASPRVSAPNPSFRIRPPSRRQA
jgi:hypothetical protein